MTDRADGWPGKPLTEEHLAAIYGPGNPPPEQDFPCCANVQDGYGHHAGCRNAPTRKPVGEWCGDTFVHPEHQGCTGVEPAYPFDLKVLPKGSPPGARMIYPLYATQAQHDDLAEEIGHILEEAMHLEACWISEDETRCVCIIEKLRALIPRCGHVEQVGTKGLTRQCLSTVHPSAPHKHVFGTV